MRFIDTRTGRVVVWVVGAVLLAAVALMMGGLVPRQPLIPLAIAGFILALGVTAAQPAAIPLAAVPLIVLVPRVDLGPVDMSWSDFSLGLATVTALVFTQRPLSAPMRNLLWLNALYQLATLFTVVLNPFTQNVLEWFHAWVLVSGALLVGWTVGRAGLATWGVNLLMVAIIVLGLITLGNAAVQYLRGDFSAVYPTWPFGMHKNFAGTVLGFGATIAYARPRWLGWGRLPADVVFWFLAVGILTTQSRQAIVALGVAVLFIAWRQRGPEQKRSTLIALAVLPALALVATLVKDQIEEGSQFNSVFQRLQWFEDTIDFWAESPWVGHGLRFWVADRGLGFQPPQVFLEVLASAGVIGLTAFVLMIGGTLTVLWKVPRVYATIGLALLLSRLTQSQLDLFWIAVQVPLPFLVIGIGLGLQSVEDRRRPWGSDRRLIEQANPSVAV